MRVSMLAMSFGAVVLAASALPSQVRAQQWNGAPGDSGLIWRAGDVALGTESTTGAARRGLLELTRPLGASDDSDNLMLSANMLFREQPSSVFQIDTRGVYAGNARSKAGLLRDETDFAVHRTAVIGTNGLTAPIPSGYRLVVAGKVLAEEVRILLRSEWADHVLAPDYRLKSLPELEQFVRTNHRLPDIPSAAEVAERGIDLGQMQSALLGKIEELTLHLIEQNRTIESIRARIATLEQQPSRGDSDAR